MNAIARKKAASPVMATRLRPPGLLPWEDADAFALLHGQMLASHAPLGPTEAMLIDRMIWCEWRRLRLRMAEAAVHVAQATDRSHDSQAKLKLLQRAGLTDHSARDQISISEVLGGNDQDDSDTIEAIREGIRDAEATLALIAAGATLEQAEARMDEDLRDWWRGDLDETDDKGQPKYAGTPEDLKRFLSEDALPWRKGWLASNSARPAIRAQVRAESFDAFRIRQLWEMEARLDRQFEKALGMLIRLQEIRRSACAQATPSLLPVR